MLSGKTDSLKQRKRERIEREREKEREGFQYIRKQKAES
jgi:hypothetical protein